MFAEARFNFEDRHTFVGMLCFPVYRGDSPLLFGNDVLSKCVVDTPNGILAVPMGVLHNQKALELPLYTAFDQRTRLALVPHSPTSSRSYLALGLQDPVRLAKRIHVTTHLPSRDIERLVSAGLYPQVLSREQVDSIHALPTACQVCQSTGDPILHPKVSLRRPTRGWNEKVVADLFYLPDLIGKSPILHIRDKATGYSETCILSSRGKDVLLSAINMCWFHRHGSPQFFSADPEFSDLAPNLELMGIGFMRAPARRHQMIGIAETRHRVLRRLVSRLTGFQHGHVLTAAERLSHATFLSNIILGGKTISSFEQARGYFPSLYGLPCRSVSQEMLDLHRDSSMRRAMHLFLRSAHRQTLTHAALPSGTPVYYFVKPNTGRGQWEKGFVESCPPGEPLVLVRAKHSRGPTRAIALQDIRLVPRTELAEELETIALQSMNLPSPVQDVRLESTDLSTKVPPSRTSTLLASAARSFPHLSSGTRFGPHHQVQSDIGACADDEQPYWLGSPPTAVISYD
jgi:hypothetical protein